MRTEHVVLLGLVLGTGCGDAPNGREPCGTTAFEGEIFVLGRDAVDLLIALDDSQTAPAERAVVQRRLADLVRILVTGEDEQSGTTFEPLRDLHVGIASADLGAAGGLATGTACEGWGAGGALVRAAAGDGCTERLPAFLSYRASRPTVHPLVAPPVDDGVRELLDDFTCAANADGPACSFGQPFEAMLRALWPATPQPWHDAPPQFAGVPPEGDGANAGFLRSDPSRGVSRLHVLLVTDGDDCSARDPAVFGAGDAAASPTARCAASDALLHGIARYVAGLRGLRPGDERLVSFAAIAGVPPDRVRDTEAWSSWNETRRRAFYDALLADPLMQATTGADGTLAPSCETAEISATPPRRVVELARALGPLGRVHSICDADWSAALSPLTQSVGHDLGSACLPRRIPRDADGRTPCRVLWELPPPEDALEGTPTECAHRAFLSPHADRPRSERGGAVCEVHQLAVRGAPDDPRLEPGAGWFYDDWSIGPHCTCTPRCNSIFFAPNLPESGILVRMQCQQTQRPMPPGADLACPDGECPSGWSCGDAGMCEPDACGPSR